MDFITLDNPRPLAPGTRLRSLEELKGLAIVLVVIFHGGGVLGLRNWVHGETGVDIFLIVSGLSLALGGDRLSAGEFWKRRFLRIFPAYWCALALFVGLNAVVRSAFISWPNLVFHALGLQVLGPEDYFFAVNDSFWFVGLIVPLYAVFFLLRRHLSNPGFILSVGLYLTVLACWAFDRTGNDSALAAAGLRIPSFFVGIVLGGFLAGPRWRLQLNLFLGFAVLAIIHLTFIRHLIAIGTLAGFAVVLFFLCAKSELKGWRPAAWVFQLLGVLGGYSYEIYLLHQPLIREYNLLVLDRWFKLPHPSLLQAFAGVCVGLLLAFAGAVALRWALYRVRLGRPARLAT